MNYAFILFALALIVAGYAAFFTKKPAAALSVCSLLTAIAFLLVLSTSLAPLYGLAFLVFLLLSGGFAWAYQRLNW